MKILYALLSGEPQSKAAVKVKGGVVCRKTQAVAYLNTAGAISGNNLVT